MVLQIPQEDRERLAELLKLDFDTLDSLYEALKEAPPRLRLAHLVADAEDKTRIPRAKLREVLRLLLTLYWLRADLHLEAEEFIDELFQAADESGDERLTPQPGGWGDLKERLSRLLSLERSLGVTAKALYLAYQFPRHYHGAQVLTDARPVFTTNPAEPPAAFIISHTLQIQVHDDGEDCRWFVMLNTDDLVDLKRVIERAIEKEQSLKQLMSSTGVPTLEWTRGQDYGD